MQASSIVKRSAILAVALLLVLASAVAAQDVGRGRLDAELARLAATSGGRAGVTAIHLETGRRVSLNGGEAFPMASTFKVPVAVQLLRRVEKGELRLDSMVTLTQADLHPGSGEITNLLNDPGVSAVKCILPALDAAIATGIVAAGLGGAAAPQHRPHQVHFDAGAALLVELRQADHRGDEGAYQHPRNPRGDGREPPETRRKNLKREWRCARDKGGHRPGMVPAGAGKAP